MRHRIQHGLALALAAIVLAFPALSQAQAPKIGIVIMHGKGGSPQPWTEVLARGLEQKGMLVANIEMPWSKRREYDVPTATAAEEVLAALAGLKGRGAQKLFVAGHSLGGTFAVHFGGVHPVDGIIAIAPGGSVESPTVAQALAPSLARARQLIGEGKGREKAQLMDYEPSKGGAYPIMSPPESYVTWFDPAGAMNATRTGRELKAPILYGVATQDYPGLRKINPPRFKGFPAHPMNKYFEPEADHLNAPSASIEEVASWTAAVAARR